MRCAADGAGLRFGRCGEAATFRVLARDAFGNQLKAGGHPFVVRVRPPLSSSRAPPGSPRGPRAVLRDQGDGTYLCEWTPAARGRHVIAVLLDRTPISGSDFVCTVI